MFSTTIAILIFILSPLVNAPIRFGQDPFPPPPSDRAQIFIADDKLNLTPLPTEVGLTRLRIDEVSKSDKNGHVELKGSSSPFSTSNHSPRFYLFVDESHGMKPPLLVFLNQKGNSRRATAMTQAGFRGLVIESTEIVKPHYRVLARDGGMIYIEIRPRQSLMPGEYAFVGADLSRLATFRVTLPTN